MSPPRLEQALGARIDVLAVVESLRPMIEALDRRIEDERALPPELIEAMYEAGIFRALAPREVGGLELHPLDHSELVFELSRINGSVGWIALINNHGGWLLEPDVMHEAIAEQGRWLTAGSFAKVGGARRVDGGYRVTGDWTFASGAPWATFLMGMIGVVDDAGEPVIDDDTPPYIGAFFPKDQVDYLDGWDSLGLRGTGSGRFKAQDVFVADRYVWKGMPAAYLDRPLYRVLTGMGAPLLLGCAQGMLDAMIGVAQRTVSGPLGPDSDRLAQEQIQNASIAHMNSLLRAALSWSTEFQRRIYEASAQAVDGEPFEPPYEMQIEQIQCDVHCARVAREIAITVADLAGTSGIVKGSKIERDLRDILTAVQHATTRLATYGPIGQYYVTRDLPSGPIIVGDAYLPQPPAQPVVG